jgi:hypothetical protein
MYSFNDDLLCNKFVSLNFSLFVYTYNDISYPKCLLCIYVLPEDGPRRPKNVGDIIMKNNVMHEYLLLVAINTM